MDSISSAMTKGSLVLLAFLALCSYYGGVMTQLPIPETLRSVMAVVVGLVIGTGSGMAFVVWLEAASRRRGRHS
jgi:ATP-dependent protease ClpP protease subunit